MSSTRIAISMGDPAGIGPEVVLRACEALADVELQAVVYGDPRHLEHIAGELRIPVRAELVAAIEMEAQPVPGRPTRSDARAALTALVAATESAESGASAALVTAPLSKEGIAAIEPSFRGHTEYLAARAGVREPLMVFAGIRPAVALLTTHLPLAVAIASVRRARILDTLRRLDREWRRWLETRPRIGIAGLDPHAGEHGLLGWGDDLEVRPAIADARRDDIDAHGPYPADSVLRREDLDVILALYHDQGTIMAKNAATPSVNTTFGLPYPRTSPDHGVAYDIAGTGTADPSAMIAAIELAADMARRHLGSSG